MSSLATDSIFIAAIRSDAEIMKEIGCRIYSTAIPLPDEDADNVPVPYIIVTFDGLTNDQTTKDSLEASTDTVNIGVEITAGSRADLARLTTAVRNQIRSYMENAIDDPLTPYDYQFTADPVQYDGEKPCYWQTLRYQCDMNNEENEQDEE